MTFHEDEPVTYVFAEKVGATVPFSQMKIQINTERLTTLLRSNISCHMNKTLDQELMEQLTAQIIESIDYFINNTE